MYIDSIKLTNFRNFRNSEIAFIHSGADWTSLKMGKPKLRNMNLLLGENGLGKTTLLKAIALAALGPAVADSGIFPYRLIRREPDAFPEEQPAESRIGAAFSPHRQDEIPGVARLESLIALERRGDLEVLRWKHQEEKRWHPIYSSSSEAFFFIGYGSTRRVEKRELFDPGVRRSSVFVRAQRVMGLFDEAYSLIPLSAWLPALAQKNRNRFDEVRDLINRLMGRGHYRFTGEMEDQEYLFDRKGLKIPFPALSDGYRAFLGWVGDLLFHVSSTCPDDKRLTDNRGIVMVDEIDLHLHPKWQTSVLPTLARVLPNLQFIVTSHSPLVVGALEWMNIIVMEPGLDQSSRAVRLERPVYGLDADQVLLTKFFGLTSTRAPGKVRTLKQLALKARKGDLKAAKELLEQLSRGQEA